MAWTPFTSAIAIAIAVPALARCAWFGQFGVLGGWDGSRWRVRALLRSARLPQSLRGQGHESHRERFAIATEHTGTAYTIGGLALAAWTFLAGAGDPTPGGPLALVLLALAVFVSLGATILFRWSGGELTRMGFESALSISGLLMVGGMASLAVDVLALGGTWAVAAAAVCGLAARDVAETVTQMRLTAEVFATAAPAPARAPTPATNPAPTPDPPPPPEPPPSAPQGGHR